MKEQSKKLPDDRLTRVTWWATCSTVIFMLFALGYCLTGKF
jgi:hypothetical protein